MRHLKSLPRANEGNGGLQLKCRCPFCGDSRKSENHTNFSIKTDFENKQPLFYQCFRASCKESGVVDGEFLKLTGCVSSQAYMELAAYNKVAEVKTKNKYNITYAKPVEIIPPKRNELNVKKFTYLCSRFDENFTLKELKKYKIIIDPLDFIAFNEIELEKEREKYYKNCMKYGIGFLSIDNSTMVVRRVDRKEYVIINLNPGKESNKLYVVPSRFNLMSTDRVILNIAEGGFDILSVSRNLGIEGDNVINAATGGGISAANLRFFIKAYGLIDRLTINIYGDNDVKLETYKKAIASIADYVNDLEANIIYNDYPKEKDFGVRSKKIQIRKKRVI